MSLIDDVLIASEHACTVNGEPSLFFSRERFEVMLTGEPNPGQLGVLTKLVDVLEPERFQTLLCKPEMVLRIKGLSALPTLAKHRTESPATRR